MILTSKVSDLRTPEPSIAKPPITTLSRPISYDEPVYGANASLLDKYASGVCSTGPGPDGDNANSCLC